MSGRFTWITRLALVLLIVIGISGYISVFTERVPPFQTDWELLLNSNIAGSNSLYKFDGSKLYALINNRPGITSASWSPDGTKIVFVAPRRPEELAENATSTHNSEVWVINADGSNLRALTNGPANESMPVWSPDSTKVAFISNRSYTGIYQQNLFITDVQNPNPIQITRSIDIASPPSWSPDGTQIAISYMPDRTDGEPTSHNLYLIDLTAPLYPIHALTNDPLIYNAMPQWNPAGDFIAFMSDRGGQGQSAYVYQLTTGEILPVVNQGYTTGNPSWSPDGTKLVFPAAPTYGTHTYRNLFMWDANHPHKLAEQLLWAEQNHVAPQWSPDGSQLVFVEDHRVYVARFGMSGNCDLAAYDLTADVYARFLISDPTICYNYPSWRPSR